MLTRAPETSSTHVVISKRSYTDTETKPTMTYQPRLYQNRTVQTGRECEERWGYMEPYVPAQGILMDVGSSAGYFGIKSMLLRSDLRVLSLEASEYESAEQRGAIASHQTDRICLVNGMISSSFTTPWSMSGDCVDLTLILSVIQVPLTNVCKESKSSPRLNV